MRRFLTIFAALTVLALACEPAFAKGKARPAPTTARGGDRADGYFDQFITGPGGQRIPVRDYPGSATVITRKMMDDFQARNICDALRLAPGVSASGCW